MFTLQNNYRRVAWGVMGLAAVVALIFLGWRSSRRPATTPAGRSGHAEIQFTPAILGATPNETESKVKDLIETAGYRFKPTAYSARSGDYFRVTVKPLAGDAFQSGLAKLQAESGIVTARATSDTTDTVIIKTAQSTTPEFIQSSLRRAGFDSTDLTLGTSDPSTATSPDLLPPIAVVVETPPDQEQSVIDQIQNRNPTFVQTARRIVVSDDSPLY